MDRILVSACLLGQKVRYDARAVPVGNDLLMQWQQEGRLVAFCPEVAGGLPVPRNPAEIEPDADAHMVLAGQARVLDQTGKDVSAAFVCGAKRALEQAQRHNCRFAILTDKSPSCGVNLIYGGKFTARLVTGMGITTAVLSAAGIQVFSQGELDHLASVLT